MEPTTIIGIVFICLGLLVFLVSVFKSSFKTYAGISEYKNIRNKFLVNKRENASEELKAMAETEDDDYDEDDDEEEYSGSCGFSLTRFIGSLIATGVAFMMTRTINDVLYESINMTDIPMAGMTTTVSLISWMIVLLPLGMLLFEITKVIKCVGDF